MFCAARDFVARLPWWAFKPTELDVEIWRLQGRLEDLIRDLSAIEDETGIDIDPEDENYRNILGVVAKEDEICRGVDYLHSELRSLSLELIRGHYLQKEIDRLTKDLEDLRALRQSGGEYKSRENKLPPKKMQ
ncbi:hypothetical protein COCOBI_18-1060 [Coccomyxa sp. Obi]|nr:hypothetical protein COCOBI_18-1060 [Coccomyxa sp. Obi]